MNIKQLTEKHLKCEKEDISENVFGVCESVPTNVDIDSKWEPPSEDVTKKGVHLSVYKNKQRRERKRRLKEKAKKRREREKKRRQNRNKKKKQSKKKHRSSSKSSNNSGSRRRIRKSVFKPHPSGAKGGTWVHPNESASTKRHRRSLNDPDSVWNR